jgi:prepilin signal peptidase PulO-like enzyme (type II secretory pathway)
LNGEIIIYLIIGILAGILATGFLAGFSAVYVFNKMPAAWLVDYGEEPEEKLYGKRLSMRPYGIILSIVFVLAYTFLVLQYDGLAYTLPSMFILWVLMLIGIADHKYMIIPDQLTVLLAIAAIGLIVPDLLTVYGGSQSLVPYFHTSFYSPILGALIGGGSIYLIGLIGSFITKKEAMGFGDVKLLVAVGFLCGIRGILIVLILTMLISGIWFILLLLAKKIQRSDNKPLGPYIVASCAIYIVFYSQVNQLVNWYLSFY